MNYCIYFKDTGIIERTASVPLSNTEVDHLEVTPEQMELFLSGKVSLSTYRVVEDRQGICKLIPVKELDHVEVSIKTTAWPIPFGLGESDFTIIQEVSSKACTVTLAGLSRAMQINHAYIVLAACLPGDPHWPYWVWNIKYSDLLDNHVKINYTGPDRFQFYTKKIFNSYSHEQYS